MSINILIINSDILLYNLYATSVARSLKSKYGEDAIIHWVSDKDIIKFLKFNKSIDLFYNYSDVKNINNRIDICINFNLDNSLSSAVIAEEYLGIGEFENEYYKEVLCCNDVIKSNLYQLFFRLSNMTWKGEGIDIGYNPSSKQIKGSMGYYLLNLPVEDVLIKEFTGLSGEFRKIKKNNNLLRQLDTLNRFEYIITDDLLVSLLSTSLKKKVYFLKTTPINHRVELFGSGKFFIVPKNRLLNL